MNRWVGIVRNQQGVALPLALFALVMLSGLLMALLSMAGNEPQISRNLTDVASARYAADAGLEWAFDRLVLQLDANNLPCDWSCFLAKPGRIMVSNQTFPGLAAAFGTFTVIVRNDIQANDTQITGQALLDTGTATTDNNQIVIVTATGTLPNGTSRQLQAAVGRIPFGVNGVFTFTTPKPKVQLPGNMTITGTNTEPGKGKDSNALSYDPNWKDPSCADQYAMTIAPGDEAAFEATLNNANLQAGKIVGKPQDPAQPGEGLNTIVTSTAMTPAKVTAFVNAIKGRADISLTSTQALPLLYSSTQAGPPGANTDGTIGPSCATDWNSPTCWGIPANPVNGTPARPKIVYVKAEAPSNPLNPFSPASLQVNDIKGAGILIVEGGTLFMKGAPGFQGIIIVTGDHVGINICCGSEHEVWGAIIVNETSTSDPVANWESTSGQHSDLYYSCKAINNALNFRATTRSWSWREL